MRLALAHQKPNPDLMLAQISPSQFREWQEFENLYTLSPDLWRSHARMVCHQYYAAGCSKTLDPMDYMPVLKRDDSEEQMQCELAKLGMKPREANS